MKKKVLAIALAAALAAVAVIGGTLAYFTDTTDPVENTFTAGDVQIELNESVTDEYGVKTEGTTAEGNEYKLVPAHTYSKDPMTTVLVESEPCYVRMKVTVQALDTLKAAIPQSKYEDYYTEDGVFLLEKVVSGWKKSVWKTDSAYGFDAATGTYEFRYNKIVDARDAAQTLTPLFTSFTVPYFLDNEDIKSLEDDGFEIDVVAEAIQSDTFADADAAWKAFDKQEKAN